VAGANNLPCGVHPKLGGLRKYSSVRLAALLFESGSWSILGGRESGRRRGERGGEGGGGGGGVS
jgi:hypothetical protein